MNLFLNFFNWKQKRAKECAAFDISDHSIEYVALGEEKGEVKIKFKDRIELPEGLVEDGVIKDTSTLVKMMRGVSSQAAGSLKNLSFGLSARVVYLHWFSVSKTKAPDIKVAVIEEAKKFFPVDFQELVVDHIIREHGGAYEVVIVAAEKKILEGYHDIMKQLGVDEVVFEPESLALLRSVIRGSEEKSPVLIVDFGFRYTGLYLVEGGEIRLNAGIRRGGEETTTAIAEKFKISRREAESRKTKLGFKDSELLLILQFVPQTIIQEIEKMMSFYEATLGQRIEKVLLLGGESLIPGMAEYFSRNVEKPVLLLAQNESILYSAAIGLALRCSDDSPSVNLFRKEVIK